MDFSVSYARCLYCDKMFNDISKKHRELLEQLKQHDKICEHNPLVIKNEQLQAEKETLKDRQRNAEIGLAEVSALNEKLQAEIFRYNEELSDSLTKTKQLQAELEKCRWIPVTERLPTKKDNGYITGCNIETLLVGNMFWSNTNADAKYLTARYTHWKSTILPPKEKPE